MSHQVIINLGNTHISFGVFTKTDSLFSPPDLILRMTQISPQGKKLTEQELLNSYRKEILPSLKKSLNKNYQESDSQTVKLSTLSAIMVSVTPSRNPTLIKEIQNTLGCKIDTLTHDMLPTIPYSIPTSIGLDRLVKILATGPLYPQKNILIIDFGTALTIDAVITFSNTDNDKDGIKYLGGMIVPGFTMSLMSLHNQTEQLPNLRPSLSPKFLSHSTEGCITGGTFHFYLQALKGIIEKVKVDFFKGEECLIILTGGDAGYFTEQLNKLFIPQSKVIQIERFNLIATNTLAKLKLIKEDNHV